MTLHHDVEQPGDVVLTRSRGLDEFPPELLGALAAHEMREPLHAIQSFLSILLHERAGPVTPLQSDFLATAKRASQRLERQIEDISIALASGCGMPLQSALIDLGERVSNCCRELEPFAAEHQVQLATEIDPRIRARSIRADPQRVDQILLNLIENAVKYAPPCTCVHVAGSQGPAGSVAVVVDNLVDGDLADELEHWFQPFFRGGRPKARNGYGLGLAIATHLVQAHGGDIMAAVQGHQVRVGFILPRVPSAGGKSLSRDTGGAAIAGDRPQNSVWRRH